MYRFSQRFIIFCFLFFSFLIYSLLYAEETTNKTAKRIFYGFSIKKAEGPTAVIKINDVPLREMNDEQFKASGTINEWIMPGKNSVSVSVKPSKKTLSEPIDAENPGLTILITEAEEGQYPDERKQILKFEWPKKLSPQKPFEDNFPFTVNYAPPSDFWSSAKPIKLNNGIKQQIRSLVSNLQNAFEKRDYDMLVTLLLYRFTEWDKSLLNLKASDEDRKKEILETYKNVLEKPAKVEPLKPDELNFHLVAENRLVWVTRKDGKPPVRVNNEGSLFDLPVYIAPVNGKWTIVR